MFVQGVDDVVPVGVGFILLGLVVDEAFFLCREPIARPTFVLRRSNELLQSIQ